MPQLGPLEIVVILVVALLVFGPNKLPEVARQVGRAFREFRRMQDNLRRDLDDVLNDDGPESLPPKREIDGARAPGAEPEPPPA